MDTQQQGREDDAHMESLEGNGGIAEEDEHGDNPIRNIIHLKKNYRYFML